MQSIEKTFHIFGDKNEIELPPRLCGRECTIGIDYLHVEFENPTSNEYIKLIASSARDADNPEGIIYSFFTPTRQKTLLINQMKFVILTLGQPWTDEQSN